jgi:alpha-N-arabinofuranosidase
MKAFKPAILALGILAAFPACAQVSVTVDASRPGAVINKNVYGQFAEHLGTGIYEGMWVGPESKIPNTRGWRNDVVGALKDLHVPLVRWPGGCFADEYHWRDGIGPRAKRPVKVNTNWGGVPENNAVGTHEFFDLVEMLGADAYVNGNLGTGTPQESAEWVEYMTSTGNRRWPSCAARNGHPKAVQGRLFRDRQRGLGLRRQHAAGVLRQPVQPLHHLPQGAEGSASEADRQRRQRQRYQVDRGIEQAGRARHRRHQLPLLHAADRQMGTQGRRPASRKANGSRPCRTRCAWKTTSAATSPSSTRTTRRRRSAFYVDEWGTWYDVETGTNPGFLFQQNTMRDAVVAALNFNIFHAHADRVRMTNIAQMVNVLQP